jgi:hypothetical protein
VKGRAVEAGAVKDSAVEDRAAVTDRAAVKGSESI